MRFDTIQEYIFLVAIGWCLGVAELANALGLSAEMGAFIAGVSLASSPISTFIAESLKPLRDFFLVLFFFALGAGVNIYQMTPVIAPALLLAGLMLALKPIVFKWLLHKTGEDAQRSQEIGVRLGQISEFSLLISVLALSQGLITTQASYLIQATTILTFVVSPYLIIMRYPTPMAVTDELRRD
jgi:Kef-type K+ transport system membrane component KefB